jgi:hypothetical protein
VPQDAESVRVGNCIIGYLHDPRPRPRWSLAHQRVREIERLIAYRHDGAPCDTDDGPVYLILACNALAMPALTGNAGRPDALAFVRARLASWVAAWTPQVPAADVERTIERAIAESRHWRADTAAKLLRLTMAERTACRITTIGATDLDAVGRVAARKERARERERARYQAKRVANGRRPRAEYEAGSVAEQARAAGVSRSTIYRRRARQAAAAAAKEPCNRSSAQHHKRTLPHVAQNTCCTPAAEARAAGTRRPPRNSQAGGEGDGGGGGAVPGRIPGHGGRAHVTAASPCGPPVTATIDIVRGVTCVCLRR